MRQKRITLVVKDPLLSALESLEGRMEKGGQSFKIDDYLLAVIESAHEDENLGYPEAVDLTELSSIIRMEANSLLREARVDDAKSHTASARSKRLKAASLELEAISMLESAGEQAFLSSVMITLSILKNALGYKKLPDV